MKTVIYEKENHIAYIYLNRSENMNAINEEMNNELEKIWDDFEQDDSLYAAIVTGKGKAFCAGLDLKTELPCWKNASANDIRSKINKGLGGGVTRGRHRLSKPVIAAVNGAAVAGGFELALACDIRIASQEAVFGVFEMKHGIHQGDGGIVRLLSIAGLGVTMDLTLTGRKINADEALRLNLVSEVVTHDMLMGTAEKYASMISGNDRGAVSSAKETILDSIGQRLDDALKLEMFNAYTCFSKHKNGGEDD
ncbi:MAG TPA: enoyl-CoA hydratase [Flexistipes sinusarabici]|uniref:Enoyl-CoA hydratase n=1 Tax=Flexistipes sinusarabici TaxID=2352 RepID=A0A3D5QBG6_FLESI|nr:enoyl-CoA hydratase [Flexistipes sinusarabici]